jgi:hypothetical protein
MTKLVEFAMKRYTGTQIKVMNKNFNKFYDCVEGGETVKVTSTDDDSANMVVTYCQLKPNGAYYAVIIVPVLAFSFMLMGLYYFKRIRGKSSSVVVDTEVVKVKPEPV